MAEFLLPDVGEGLTEAEVVEWKVKVGDVVAINDIVVEIETAKSLVELPVPFAGRVSALLVAAGTTVPVGTAIISVTTAAEVASGAPAQPPAGAATQHAAANASDGAETSTAAAPAPVAGQREAVLVGYGPRMGQATRRARRGAVSDTTAAATAALHATFTPGPLTVEAATPAPSVRVLAKPPVRKLAKDLGIDLSTLTPSGADGVITRADVETARASLVTVRPHAAGPPSGSGWAGLAREERVPIKSVRKATAAAVTASAFTAPHVTEWVTVDVSKSMSLLQRLKGDRAYADVKLSPMTLAARAVCLAIPRSPEVNSRWDEAAAEIVVQRFINLGVAVASPRGLVVPNIKDAHRLDLHELAAALGELAQTARAGRTTPTDMQGGTFTITNVGVFGVDGGTPILPPGESAILALGAIADRPWVHKGKVRPRKVMTLALSFDHRVVDGEQGSRFLADVATLMSTPEVALAWAQP